MTLKYQTTNFESPDLLPFFLLKPLKSQHLYEAFVKSWKNKEVDLEFKGMLLSKTEQQLALLKRLENRFAIYGKTLPNENQIYTFRFKSIETGSKSLQFSDRKTRLKNLSSYVFAYNSRRYLLNNTLKNVKNRLLALTKGGFKLSFFGQRVLLTTKPKMINKKSSYNLWGILNMKQIGILSLSNLQKWKVNILRTNSAKNIKTFAGKKSILYYKDLSFNSSILLKKNVNKILS
jgi:hypothetical protein